MNPETQDATAPAPTTIQVTTASATAVRDMNAVQDPPAQGAHKPPGGPLAENKQEALGVGTEGEITVWTGSYSLANFTGRFLVRIAATVVWLVLLRYLGDREHYPGRLDWSLFVWITGAVVLLYWLMLFWQILMARLGHRYELTNRRLFVVTGAFRRRRDQMELLKVQDVYVKQQGLFYRLLDLGTVVIESSEERLPIHYLSGVKDPNGVMDRIWHHTRMERDLRSVKVDQV